MMPLPHDPQAPAGVTDYLAWKRRVERLLSQLDSRIARAGAARTGEGVLWFGGTLPNGLLQANGQVVTRADYPQLFDVIGTTFNTGGEAATAFRLPTLATPSAGVWAVRT